jgi:hypothetical protein
LLKAPTTQVYLGNMRLLTRPLTCDTFVQTRVQWEGRPNIVQGTEALIPCESPWALLTLKRRLERGGVSMAYKVYKIMIS